MHHICAQDIPMEARRPHLIAYMGQVRKALLNPSLTARQRERLQAQLDRIRADLRGRAG